MKRLFTTALVVIAMAFQGAIAQDLTIASDDFTGCLGYLNDSNPIGQYANNEDETFTICAGDGETIINIYFIGFTVPAGDVLEIYDGVDMTAPLIGSYDEEDLLFVNTSSTNAFGCLTLHWTSDGSNVGDFAAVITCGPPCIHPIVGAEIVNDSGNPLLLCPNESYTLDASTTQFFEGATYAAHEWDFGDGTTNTTDWPAVTHTYSQPGIYRINLVVTDNTGCQNLNLLEQLVYVSTQPTFNLSTDPPLVCQNGEANLVGEVIPTTYAAEQQTDFGDGVYIPDNQGCFADTIYVNGYLQGAVVDNINDIAAVTASLEHTYLTDITISLICPDGSTMDIYSQDGPCGNVDLGFPDPADDGVPGVGIDYTWDPETTYPDFGEACGDSNYSLTGGTDGGGNYLAEGTYAPVGTWDALIGCPVNGPWIFQICDIVGVDDGWIFNWGITFDGSLLPENNSFTPYFDPACEFTTWTGNDIIEFDATCDSVIISPSQAGTVVYTYSATDDFGCTYTQDISVNVVGLPDVEAQDIAICVSDVDMNVTLNNPYPGMTYNYSWSPDNGTLSNVNTQNPSVSGIDEESVYTVTVSPAFDANCIGTANVTVGILSPPNIQTTVEEAYFCGTPITVSAQVINGGGVQYSYLWLPATGLSNPASPSPTLNTLPSDPYELVVAASPAWDLLCIAYDTMYVSTPPTPDFYPPFADSICVGADYLLYAPDQPMDVNYQWSYAPLTSPGNFTAFSQGNPITVLDPGYYQLVTSEEICGFSTTYNVVVTNYLCNIIIPNVFTPNNDGSNDSFEVSGLRDFPNSTVEIYNRWGNKVYESSNYYNQWDAKDYPDGTYYYILGVRDQGGNGYTYYDGHVTVIRD